MKPGYGILITILLSILTLPACEDLASRRVQFYIESIVLDREIVAQGKPINLGATFNIEGTTSEQSPSVMWESDFGIFSNPEIITTVWYAPDDYLGDVTITLTASFMGHSDVAERAVRIVKTPAVGYGSVSGIVLDDNQAALSDVIVNVLTGETDTTDGEGYFYIPYIPQGESGLIFSNVPYPWATDLPGQITITGSNHEHLGDIVFYLSLPAEITGYNSLPEYQALLSIEHEYPTLAESNQLFGADDINGTGAKLIRTIDADIAETMVQEDVNEGFYAIRTIPANGEISPYSEWKQVNFVSVIDPDAEGSSFLYNNFFTATLRWASSGYESYYKGFRVAEAQGSSWAYVSPLLSVNTRNFELNTVPGQTGSYYVMAVSNNNYFNADQPEEQKIPLNVPVLGSPADFRGTIQSDNTIRLSWEPLGNDDSWYSGYLIERRVVSSGVTTEWEELTRINVVNTGTYTDENTSSGNEYHYRISSYAYPDAPTSAYYSQADSIIVDLN